MGFENASCALRSVANLWGGFTAAAGMTWAEATPVHVAASSANAARSVSRKRCVRVVGLLVLDGGSERAAAAVRSRLL